ncbi:hypothetical protein VNO80_03237 [Phaseolus coccineus]|uniref:DUF4283 domain-containing protein n=1 Tax=Phaseolus coccineus TaxID=3886 RepID=A0AAN9NR33_PHACN
MKRSVQPRHVWRPRVQQKQKLSYAQVVVDKKVSCSQESEKASCSQEVEGMKSISVKVESSSWLDGCFVGHFVDIPNIQAVKESYIMGGFILVRLRYLGEKFVLMSCDNVGIIGKLIEDNKDWFDGMFESVHPWNDAFTVNEKFAWVRCRGIPLQLWCSSCFECIGALVGKVVEVDKATVKREVLEFACLRVKIPVGGTINMVKEVWGDDYMVNSVAGSEDGGGASVESVFSEYREGDVGCGEEVTVQCQEAWEESLIDAVCQRHANYSELETQRSGGGARESVLLNERVLNGLVGLNEVNANHLPCNFKEGVSTADVACQRHGGGGASERVLLNEGMLSRQPSFNEEYAKHSFNEEHADYLSSDFKEGVNYADVACLRHYGGGARERVSLNKEVLSGQPDFIEEHAKHSFNEEHAIYLSHGFKEGVNNVDVACKKLSGGGARERVILNEGLLSDQSGFIEEHTNLNFNEEHAEYLSCGFKEGASNEDVEWSADADGCWFGPSHAHVEVTRWVGGTFGLGPDLDKLEQSEMKGNGLEVGANPNREAGSVRRQSKFVGAGWGRSSVKGGKRRGAGWEEEGWQGRDGDGARDDVGVREGNKVCDGDGVHRHKLLEVVNSRGESGSGIGETCLNVRTVKIKEVALVMESSETFHPLYLSSRKMAGIGKEVSGLAEPPFADNNLFEVRVDQAGFLGQQPVTRIDVNVTADSAIENCNKIYRLKNEKKRGY